MFVQGSTMIKTLVDIPLALKASFPGKMILQSRSEKTWKGMTSEEFCRSVEDLSCALLSLGIKNGDTCAIFSGNCPEWLIADFAVMSCGAVSVPIHEVLPPDQAGFILRDSGARVIFVSDERLLKKIKPVLDSLPARQCVITIKKCSIEAEGCMSLDAAYADGGRLRERFIAELDRLRASVMPDDLATIIYTSGTTGDPKGVMLTHRNFLSNIEAVVAITDFNYRDVALSLLPLSHVLERMADYTLLSRGATVAFSASYKTLQRDFMEVRPTVAVVVPRILEVMQARILSSIHSSLFFKQKLFSLALSTNMKRCGMILLGQKPPLVSSMLAGLLRALVFRKVQETLGGRLRFFISGGAALSPEIGRFYYAMGVTICEGYGLTETSPCISVNTPHAPRFGTVGKVLSGVEVMLSDENEIMVRGPNVMRGYYNNDRATAEVFRDGWFCTGDIGEVVDGCLVIRDRKKNIIVTSSGKNVAPQRVESFLQQSPLINTAVVFGDLRSYISALIVPDFANLAREASQLGVEVRKGARTIDDEKIINLFRKEISSVSKPLASYEKVKRFALLGEELTIEKGEITPTMKVRRDVILRKYRDVIDTLYGRETDLESGDI